MCETLRSVRMVLASAEMTVIRAALPRWRGPESEGASREEWHGNGMDVFFQLPGFLFFFKQVLVAGYVLSFKVLLNAHVCIKMHKTSHITRRHINSKSEILLNPFCLHIKQFEDEASRQRVWFMAQ